MADYNYDQASDIWSLGIIFAELLNSINESNVKNRQVFRGNSCYPISPMETSGCDKQDVSTDDHIFKIIEKMDDFDSTVDLSFITSVDALYYVKKIRQNSKPKVSISNSFPNSNPQLVEMVRQMLEFNPYFRPSAQQLI